MSRQQYHSPISQEWSALALSVRTTGGGSIPLHGEETDAVEPSSFRQSQSHQGKRFYTVPDAVLLWTHQQVFTAVKQAAEAYLMRYQSVPTSIVVSPGVYARFVQASGQAQSTRTSPLLYLHGPGGYYAVVPVQTYPLHERVGSLLERSFVFLYDSEKEKTD